jgi:hypothetical protein
MISLKTFVDDQNLCKKEIGDYDKQINHFHVVVSFFSIIEFGDCRTLQQK